MSRENVHCFKRKRQQFYFLHFSHLNPNPHPKAPFSAQKLKWIIQWSRNTNDSKSRIWELWCPAMPSITSTSQLRNGSSSSRSSHLSGKGWTPPPWGVFSNLKDSMVLIPNSWKCCKSTNVFENIQVFQLGSTKSPGLDSLGMEFLGSAPHLGIPCPTAAPAQLQTSRLAQPGFICCAWEQKRSTSKKTCNSSRETFLLSLWKEPESSDHSLH